jgi:hypothetical protein
MWLALFFCVNAFSFALPFVLARRGLKSIHYNLTFNDFADYGTLGLVFLSIMFSDGQYFALSSLEALALCYVCGTYFFDWGMLVNERDEMHFSVWLHHVGATLGIAFILYTGRGGGLLVRLLLDIFSNVPISLCNHKVLIGKVPWGTLYVISFALVRLFWYPLCLAIGMHELWLDLDNHIPLFVLLCGWFLFSTADHVLEFPTVWRSIGYIVE